MELKETSYPYLVKSEILFLKKDYSGALDCINKASKFNNSPETRINMLLLMHKIFHYSHNESKAKEILSELQKTDPRIQPNYQGEVKDYVYFFPIQVEEQLKKAMTLYMGKNFDAALDEFLKSMEIKETALANRCVGDILLAKNDNHAMLYYQKAYPDYQKNPGFLLNMGLLYLKNNQPDKVRSMLEKIKALDPGYPKLSLLEEGLNSKR